MDTTTNRIQTSSLATAVKTFWRDEEAATAVEYGLIAALIAAAIAATVGSLGTAVKNTFTNITSSITSAGR